MIVGFFSLSAAKQDLYIFPIVPAMAALSGLAIARALDEGSSGGAVRTAVAWTSILVGAAFLVMGVALVYLARTAGGAYALAGVMSIGIVAIAGGLATVLFAVRASLASSLISMLAVTIAVNWIFVLRTLPSFEAYKPVPAFADLLRARAGAGDLVATHGVAMPSLVFYLRRHVEEVFDREHLVELFQSKRNVYAVLTADAYEALRQEMAIPPCVIDHRPTFDVKLRNMLNRQPLPELLIVTNKCS
jgi:4-amino-4-deoxy-L-arabinose transferase-like glycosyltransferase